MGVFTKVLAAAYFKGMIMNTILFLVCLAAADVFAYRAASLCGVPGQVGILFISISIALMVCNNLLKEN